MIMVGIGASRKTLLAMAEAIIATFGESTGTKEYSLYAEGDHGEVEISFTNEDMERPNAPSSVYVDIDGIP